MPAELSCVLLVEDDPAHAALIARAFEDEATPCALLTARNLQQAHGILSEQSPELLIVDLGLPDGTGLALLSADVPLPVLVLTAQGDERTAVEAMRRGAMDYLVKTPQTLSSVPRAAQRAWREWGSQQAQQAAEQACAASEARLSGILDIAPQAIISVNDAGAITLFNQGAMAIFGLSAEDMHGESLAKLLCPRTMERFRARLEELAQQEQCTVRISEDEGFRGRHASGDEFAIEIAIVKVTVSDSTTYTLILEDVTERHHQEELRRQSQKMQALGQLTGGISHDFNNLLMVIQGNLELLRLTGRDGSEFEELISEALESAERGADLTRSLLAFARRQPLASRAVDVHATIRQLWLMLERTFKQQVSLQLTLCEQRPVCLLDPGGFENALLNLSLNARDAMPTGGTLHLQTRCLAHHKFTGGPAVQISLTDTGIGMSPQVQEQVFEPFFTTKHLGQGTGLGMSMIYSFVHQSGGMISIVSAPGEGTTITIVLPDTRQPPTPGLSTSMLHYGNGERILVVDDNPALLQLARNELSMLHYRVETVPSGTRALEVLRTSPPFALVLTDIMLQDSLSGTALAAQIQQLYPGVPVVLTSGIPRPVDADPSELFLQKPYTISKLAGTLHRALKA